MIGSASSVITNPAAQIARTSASDPGTAPAPLPGKVLESSILTREVINLTLDYANFPVTGVLRGAAIDTIGAIERADPVPQRAEAGSYLETIEKIAAQMDAYKRGILPWKTFRQQSGLEALAFRKIVTALEKGKDAAEIAAMPKHAELTAEIIEKINEQREALAMGELTQSDIARSLNVSVTAVSHVIRGTNIGPSKAVVPRKSITIEIVEKIKAKLNFYTKRLVSIEELIQESGLGKRTVYKILSDLKKGKDPAAIASHEYAKLTPELIEKINEQRKALEEKRTTQVAIGEELNLCSTTVSQVITGKITAAAVVKTKKRKEATATVSASASASSSNSKKPKVEITLAVIEKMKSRIDEYKKSHITKKAIRLESGLDRNRFDKIFGDLEKGRDHASLAAWKEFAELSPELAQEIMAHRAEIAEGSVSMSDIAKRHNLLHSTVKGIISSTLNGRGHHGESSEITIERIKKVEAELDAYKKGLIAKARLMEISGLSYTSIDKILKGLKEGKDPAEIAAKKKKYRRVTPELRKEIIAARKAANGERVTYVSLAERFDVSTVTIRKIIRGEDSVTDSTESDGE